MKVSPRNLGVQYPPMICFSIPWKFFREMITSYRSVKVFLPQKFVIYISAVLNVECSEFCACIEAKMSLLLSVFWLDYCWIT